MKPLLTFCAPFAGFPGSPHWTTMPMKWKIKTTKKKRKQKDTVINQQNNYTYQILPTFVLYGLHTHIKQET